MERGAGRRNTGGNTRETERGGARAGETANRRAATEAAYEDSYRAYLNGARNTGSVTSGSYVSSASAAPKRGTSYVNGVYTGGYTGGGYTGAGFIPGATRESTLRAEQPAYEPGYAEPAVKPRYEPKPQPKAEPYRRAKPKTEYVPAKSGVHAASFLTYALVFVIFAGLLAGGVTFAAEAAAKSDLRAKISRREALHAENSNLAHESVVNEYNDEEIRVRAEALGMHKPFEHQVQYVYSSGENYTVQYDAGTEPSVKFSVISAFAEPFADIFGN